MIFETLKTNCYFKDQGYTYKENGMVGYMPNQSMFDGNEWIEYDGRRVISIYHYEGDEEIYILTVDFMEDHIPYNEGFHLYLATLSRRAL